MNVADTIRSMNDLELAQLLNEICSELYHVMSEKLEEQGIPHDLIEIPCLSVAHHLAFLRRPAEEVFNFESEENNG